MVYEAQHKPIVHFLFVRFLFVFFLLNQPIDFLSTIFILPSLSTSDNRPVSSAVRLFTMYEALSRPSLVGG